MLQPTSLLVAAFLFVFSACDVSHLEAYEEPITSLTYILTPDSGSAVVLQYLDRDGEGGQPAMINSCRLVPHTVYHGQVLINSMGKHFTDTTSIVQHPETHQVFFLSQNGALLDVTYADQDANGLPVGFLSTISTGSASAGKLTIIIKHHPNKAAEDVSSGNLNNAGGSTDLEVNFDINISN